MKPQRERFGLGRRSTERTTGREGRVMFVNAGARFRKRYQFTTHGLTAADCVERMQEIEARHAIKCAAIERLQTIAGAEWIDGQFRFRLSPVTVRDRGSDNVEIVLMIRRDIGGGRWKLLDHMPLRKVYRSAVDVPSNDEVEQIARAVAANWAQKEREQQQFAADVAALLGDQN